MGGLVATSQRLWSSFSQQVLSLVAEGLEELASDSERHALATMREVDLNRHLLQRMNRIVYHRKKGMLSISPPPLLSREHTWDLRPIPEAQNQPSPDDPERTPREDKRPDFQWGFHDDLDPDPDRAIRTFVVECKRLRHPAGRWAFNSNYVDHGVRRFIAVDYLYGMDDESGGMVGYIQAMSVKAVWAEVALRLEATGLPALPEPAPKAGSASLYATVHDLPRNRGHSPFRLFHVWVDLRSSGGAERPEVEAAPLPEQQPS